MSADVDSSAIDMTVAAGGNVDSIAGLKDDHLGFRPYVEAVYSYLKNEETKAPFTISIEGDWGSGKSSFMLQLKECLDVDKLPAVRFNAWRHDKVETMWAAFALHFIKEMLHKLNPAQRIWANIRLRWKRFDFVKGWFTVVKTVLLFAFYALMIFIFVRNFHSFKGHLFDKDKFSWESVLPFFGSAGILIGLLFFLKGLSEVAGNPFKADLQKFVNKPNYEGNVAFIEEFHRDFGQTVDILSGKHAKVFVFIDDLDRADIPKSAELMQGLNMMMLEGSKLIFIIGMDREKVAAGIASKYKDLLPFLNTQQAPLNTEEGLDQALIFGYQFLEKFIQLSFQIPTASPAFTKQFIDSLSNATSESVNAEPVRYKPVLVIKNGKDADQFREVILLLAKFFDHNPRRIKQFVNSFRLKAHIANSTGLFIDRQAAGMKALTIPQLGKFIALCILAPQFVEDLWRQPGLLTREIIDPNVDWTKNELVADIVELKPPGTGAFPEYDMKNLDILSLMQTSPVFRPDAGAAQTSATTTSTTTGVPPKATFDPSDIGPERRNSESSFASSRSYKDDDPRSFPDGRREKMT